MAEPSLELGVAEFVALLNQTLDYAYPNISVTGELANLKIWRDRLVFFDLKDDEATLNCFAFITQLPGPLEDGMLLKVGGQPRYHQTRGFSFNVRYMQPAGEGSIRRAADLLQAKLANEGLFDESRKRSLPYPPQRIGLITAVPSAAYADFLKILQARWSGLHIETLNVQVQGENAPEAIVGALKQFNSLSQPPDVLVIIRGGGSADDLAAFSTEQVTRAVAASRVPTLVAIGHEIDLSLAELAADRRASTPSNAAELLVPDRKHALAELVGYRSTMGQSIERLVRDSRQYVQDIRSTMLGLVEMRLEQSSRDLAGNLQLLEALNPNAILKRGYAIVRLDDSPIRNAKVLKPGGIVETQLAKGRFQATVKQIETEK